MSNSQVARNAEYYAGLPYTTVLKRDEDGDIVARIEELDGCVAHGADDVEALANLREIKQAWIEECIASGRSVPEPETCPEVLPSGKWVQRVPRSLHQRLTKLAKREGVSLNALVTAMLSDAAVSRMIFTDVVMGQPAPLVGCTAAGLMTKKGHTHADVWGGASCKWETLVSVKAGAVALAQSVMPLMVPRSGMGEIHANEKEAIAFIADFHADRHW